MKSSASGILVLFAVVLGLNASAATFFVDAANPLPVPPFTNWQTAATDIQSAIDASSDGDQILVTNGVYASCGRIVDGALTNRVVIDKAVTLQSVNGPTVTLIQGNSDLGSNAVRCVYMAPNSVLSGFTLTNGGTLNSGDLYLEQSGGGVWATKNSTVTVTNCVMIGNVAHQFGGGAYYGNICNSSIMQNSAYSGGGLANSFVTNCLIASNSAKNRGGGAYFATLMNSTISKNVAAQQGGGAYYTTLHGCLVVSNSASMYGGGISFPELFVDNCSIIGNFAGVAGGGIESGNNSYIENCIIYYNSASDKSSSNYDSGKFYNCCTVPLPSTLSFNNITNEPGFTDLANGDFRLQSNSPCINGGFGYVGLVTDLAGDPRIVDGLVDIGAYEYQTPGSILPIYFVQQYGLSSDGLIDSDGDGMNNWAEAVSGTNPTNAASILKIVSISSSGSGLTLRWPSVSGVMYYLQRSTNLAAQPAFSSIQSNFYAPSGTFRFTDVAATNGGPYFYRVGVQ